MSPPRGDAHLQRSSPEKVVAAPSQRDCSQVLGVPRRTLSRVDALLIKKRQQLSAGKKGVYWALAKHKKGYSKIGKELRSLLVATFNDHSCVIVLPKAKDTLQVKNADGKKVLVRKVLTQVGLGTIFSNIVHNLSTITRPSKARLASVVPLHHQRTRVHTPLHQFLQADVRLHQVCWPAHP
jgi:hypothetical protein